MDRDTDPRDAEELAQIKQRLREKGIKVSMLIHDIEGYVNDRLLEIRGTVIAELDKLRLQIHRVASLLGLPCCLFEAAAESVSDKAKTLKLQMKRGRYSVSCRQIRLNQTQGKVRRHHLLHLNLQRQ